MRKSPKRPLPPNRISRKTLASILQVSERTIKRWEKAGVAPVEKMRLKMGQGRPLTVYSTVDIDIYQAWFKMRRIYTGPED